MFPFSERRISRGLVGLSIVCLVLCHGVFGALHLFSAPLASPAPTGEHVAEYGPTEGHDAAGDHAQQHGVVVAYFAVLLGLLVGVTFLLLRNARQWCQVHAPRLFGDRLPTMVPNLPRGPTAPLLQVFRL